MNINRNFANSIHTNKNNGRTILRFFIGTQQVQYSEFMHSFNINKKHIDWRIDSIPAHDIYLLEIASPDIIKTFRKVSQQEVHNFPELITKFEVKKVD